MRYPIFRPVSGRPAKLAVNPMLVSHVFPYGENQTSIHISVPSGDGHIAWVIEGDFDWVVSQLDGATAGPAPAAPVPVAR